MPPTAPTGRPAARVALAYLAAALVPLAAGVGATTAPALLAAHAAALAAGTWLARAGRDAAPASARARAADWLPLLLVPLLYAELPAVIAGVARLGGAAPVAYHDAAVIRWDATLFGTLSRDLAARWPSRALSELLHACYLSYYAIIYVPPALLYGRLGRARRGAFAETLLGVTLAFAACFAAFALFPVQGPWYEWPPPAAAPDGPARDLVQRVLRAGSSRGTAFPSSHVAVSVAQTLLALRHRRPLGVACAVLTTGLALGAVYGGFHYAADVAAGAAVGALAAAAAIAWSGRAGQTAGPTSVYQT